MASASVLPSIVSVRGKASAWATESLTAKRVKACIIDLVLVYLLLVLASDVVDQTIVVPALVRWLTAPIAFPFLLLGYFTVTEGSALAASLGMRLLGLRIRARDGGRLDYRTALVRAVVFYLTTVFLTPLVLLIIPLTGGRRALHDFAVGGTVTEASGGG